VAHVGNGAVGDVWVGVGAKRACGRGAVDSWHGTGGEGSSHPCTKTYLPLYFTLIAKHSQVLIIHCICCKYLFVLFIFSPLQVKNQPCDEGTKHAFYLGPLAWLRTMLMLHQRYESTASDSANA
jgi:hypothetical protein